MVTWSGGAQQPKRSALFHRAAAMLRNDCPINLPMAVSIVWRSLCTNPRNLCQNHTPDLPTRITGTCMDAWIATILPSCDQAWIVSTGREQKT